MGADEVMKIRWIIGLENTFSRDLDAGKYAYFLKEITNASLALWNVEWMEMETST